MERVPRPNVAQPVSVKEGSSVLEVLRALAIPPDAVVVLREESPVPVDASVREGDRLRVVNVFSGG